PLGVELPVVLVVVGAGTLAVVTAGDDVIEAAAGEDLVGAAEEEVPGGRVDIDILAVAPECRVAKLSPRAQDESRAARHAQTRASNDRNHESFPRTRDGSGRNAPLQSLRSEARGIRLGVFRGTPVSRPLRRRAPTGPSGWPGRR